MSEPTASLLVKVRAGDLDARDRLFQRFLPLLRDWAHGRLPTGVRDISDTDDLVQLTLVGALGRLGSFEPRHEGAFLAYLRRIFLNKIRDEIRRAGRRPRRDPLSDELRHSAPTPLELAIGRETMVRYERGLARLSPEHRQAVILRLEFCYSCEEVAAAMDRPTGNAARQLIARALLRLAQVIDERD